MLIDYIYKTREGKYQRVGVLFGVELDGELKVGFSLCDKWDDFDEDYGIALAMLRALSDEVEDCPWSIAEELNEFSIKCAEALTEMSLFPEKKEYSYPLFNVVKVIG